MNGSFPCSSGIRGNWAWNGVALVRTVAERALESPRLSAVQSAPSALQSVVALSATVTLPFALSGVTVTVQLAVSPATSAAAVTAPPVTLNAWSRMAAAVAVTASLNARRNEKALPSWVSGMASKAAVSGSDSAACGLTPSLTAIWLWPILFTA